MKTEKKIYDQHRENKTMLEKLFFYKDEISIMQRRLEEIAKKNNSKEVLEELEHFQNQLLLQSNNADELKHAIRECEGRLETTIKQNDVAIDHRIVQDHVLERESVTSFENNFNDLRHELNKFLAKWM